MSGEAASGLHSSGKKMKMDFMFTIDPDHSASPVPYGEAFVRSLSGLPVGGCGRVVSVDVSAADLERLEVMGLCAGRLVCVIKDGDPMIVRVLGTRIGLAAALAARVHLRPEATPSTAPTEA
jgi:Fe2+ transport system protein FeoA